MAHHITIDWFAKELFGAGEEAAGEEDGGGRLVEQLERPVVDRDLVHLVTFIQIRKAQLHMTDVPTSKKNLVAVVTAPSSSAMMPLASQDTN